MPEPKYCSNHFNYYTKECEDCVEEYNSCQLCGHPYDREKMKYVSTYWGGDKLACSSCYEEQHDDHVEEPKPKTIKIKIKIKKPTKKPEPKTIKKPKISEEDKKEVKRLENVIRENKNKLRQLYSDDGSLDMFSETFDTKKFLSVADVFIEYEEDLFNPAYTTRKPTNKDTARFIHYIKTGEVGCTTNAYKVTPKQVNWAKKNFNKVRSLYKKEQRKK